MNTLASVSSTHATSRNTSPTRGPGLEPGAYLTPTGILRISAVELEDSSITEEARRWSTGHRGEPVPLDQAAGSNLDTYVRAAMSIGTQMLGHASDASVTGLATQVTRISERAASASAALVRSAGEAAAQATAASTRAAREASESTTRTVTAAMKQFEKDAQRTLNARVAVVDARVNALLGGETSEVATAVRAVISAALAEGQAGWQASATATLAEMQRVFDPANPANPLAAAARQIDQTQQRHHAELGARIDRVTELVAAAAGAATSAAALAAAHEHSPAKGLPFEEDVANALETVAAGLGASYERTGHTTGTIRNSRKGDAVIELTSRADGEPAARILVEITTQESARDWPSYLREAEKNRGCQVGLGIVRTAAAVPGGEPLALLGAGRAVVAFDPATDSPALARAAIQLLAVEASRRVAVTSGTDVTAADSKIVGARQQLAELVALHKIASGVRDNAGKVVTGLDTLHMSLCQTLDQALAALRAGSNLAA